MFKAGTNPIERQSHLALRAARGQSGKPSLQLPTVVGRKYILEGSASLRGNGWTAIQTDIQGTGGTVELTPAGTANHEFFRVRVID